MKPLPLRAVYSVGELAEASGVDRRRLRRALTVAGVPLIKIERLYLVLLPDLERNGRLFWDAIQVAQARKEEVDEDS